MSSTQVRQLIDALLHERLITDEQQTQLQDQNFSDLKSAETYIRRVIYIPSEKWAQLASKVINVPYMNLIGKAVGATILNTIPQDLAENYQIVVFEREGGVMKVGMADPTNFKAMEAVEFIARKAGVRTQYFIISNESFRAAVKQYESLGEEVG